MKRTATVTTEIDWYQVLNALDKLVETREPERLDTHDGNRILRAAYRLHQRIIDREVGPASAEVVWQEV